MTPMKVSFAILEAERFITRARRVMERVGSKNLDVSFGGDKDTAALRRASLDLTRSLAEMRRCEW